MKHPHFYTVSQFVASARISRRTFDDWLRKGFAPEMERDGPNGPWRIPREAWDAWCQTARNVDPRSASKSDPSIG